jgi:hypothetical protein
VSSTEPPTTPTVPTEIDAFGDLIQRGIRLDEIIGGTEGDDRNRVVTFHIESDKLWMTEACDDWFGTALNSEEVDKLIAWLIKVRVGMS